MAFKTVSSQVDFPKMEKEVLRYWKKNNIFEESVQRDAPKGHWTFLDGPPFVTGKPHYGSLLPRIAKDVFPRFWTMKGYRVRRVWGWDGHGLPVENKVEVKLGIKRKKDIEEKIGVEKFIKECLLYVEQTSSEWEWYVDRIGEWVDFTHSYKTWDKPYMESVMWVFKQIYDRGYIYKGLRVSLYCPHCSTPISNFEVAMDPDNYKEITEPADTYKYQLTDEPDTYFLAWSTTPWNKIATTALAVNPSLDYVKIEQGKEKYILAKSTQAILKSVPYKVIDEFKGEKLLGRKFRPHYDYFRIDESKKAFIVIAGDFVTADEGTGIVTIAAYGEEDLAVMQRDNIQIEMHVDDEGKLKPNVPNWAGMNYLDVNSLVNEDLSSRGLIYKDEPYTHTVPTCWRCQTRLFYAPQNAWFINVQDLKDQMVKTNEGINWFPSHFKHGRFLNSLLAAPDWCISRSRYWGSPVPVWECEKCDDRFVPGSISELENWANQHVTSLHKPDIDEITGVCAKCGATARRVTEVLDSWIEAGSASFAERHYPFETAQKLEDFFPPDFIVEYTGQIRAWFYVLHVITNAIFKSKAFKNAVVTGVIQGTDGRKMSKNYGNYPDPKEMLEKYGGDALRLYLLGTPVMKAEDIRISEEEYRNQVRTFLLTFWNVYSFFVTYANLGDFQATKVTKSPHILDRWIVELENRLTADVSAGLEVYDTVKVVDALKAFVVDMSTWYIRRSRDRVGPEFFSTCYEVLVTYSKLLAPIAPFVSEEVYRNLTGQKSVHLERWLEAAKYDENIIRDMEKVRKICELGHAERKRLGLRVRQPLAKITVHGESLSEEMVELIREELNIKKVEFASGEMAVELETALTPELLEEGEAREIMRAIQDARKLVGTRLDEKVVVYLPRWPTKFEELIKEKTLALDLRKGEKLHVERAS